MRAILSDSARLSPWRNPMSSDLTPTEQWEAAKNRRKFDQPIPRVVDAGDALAAQVATLTAELAEVREGYDTTVSIVHALTAERDAAIAERDQAYDLRDQADKMRNQWQRERDQALTDKEKWIEAHAVSTDLREAVAEREGRFRAALERIAMHDGYSLEARKIAADALDYPIVGAGEEPDEL